MEQPVPPALHDLTASIRHYLTAAPASLFAGTAVEIEDSWEGDNHLLWRVAVQGQIAVVKLFMDAGQARSRRQFDAHQRFAPCGLAPVPLWTDRYPQGLARQLLAYVWSPGAAIDPSASGAVESWATAVAQLHAVDAGELRRFSPHPVNLDYFWRIDSASLSHLLQWLSAQQSGLAAFMTVLAGHATADVEASQTKEGPSHPAPVHGDLRIAHTLFDRGSVTLLDWELFGIGDPALDVARLLHHERHQFEAEGQGIWLQQYLRVAGVPPIEKRIARYMRLLALHDVIFLLVGLEQQSRNALDQSIVDALPFLEVTLINALGEAAAAYDLPLPSTIFADVQAIMQWIQHPRN